MKTRIIIPVAEENGLDSHLAEHFGRSPYFAIVDLDENYEVSKIETIPNTGEHFGGTGYMHEKILSLKPNTIIVYEIGLRGLISFQRAGVTVLKANANTVREVVTAYKRNELLELTEGCRQARHRC